MRRGMIICGPESSLLVDALCVDVCILGKPKKIHSFLLIHPNGDHEIVKGEYCWSPLMSFMSSPFLMYWLKTLH